jgi:hypothetical protein
MLQLKTAEPLRAVATSPDLLVAADVGTVVTRSSIGFRSACRHQELHLIQKRLAGASLPSMKTYILRGNWLAFEVNVKQ